MNVGDCTRRKRGHPTDLNLKGTPTLYLIAPPSFIEGAARIVDFGGSLNEYNVALNGSQADSIALQADITALRRDLAAVRKRLLTETANAKTQRPLPKGSCAKV